MDIDVFTFSFTLWKTLAEILQNKTPLKGFQFACYHIESRNNTDAIQWLRVGQQAGRTATYVQDSAGTKLSLFFHINPNSPIPWTSEKLLLLLLPKDASL